MTDFSKEYDPELNEFPTDEHRRVVGNLTIPRSLDNLTRVVDEDDNTRLGVSNPKRVAEVLKDCVDSGWVTELGDSMDPEAVLKEANDSDDSINVPKDMGEAWVTRARAGRRGAALGDGPKYVMSKVGLDKLNGSIPNEPPPLAGTALVRALEATVESRQAVVDIEKQAEGRTKEEIKAAQDGLAEAKSALAAAQNGGGE